MAQPISLKDLRAMVDLINHADDDQAGDTLPAAILEGLSRLVPNDAICLFELDVAHRSCGGHGCVEHPERSAVFWAHYWDCPPCSYPERNGDFATVTKTSDFYSQRQWHNSPMYCDYLRHSAVEDEIVSCLATSPGRSVRLLLRRASGTFRERDRMLIALLRPHLGAIYETHARHRTDKVQLTPRQRDLLHLVAEGYTNREIGRRLCLSEGTVRKHLENIYGRLGVSSRTAAVARVKSLGIINSEATRTIARTFVHG